MSKSLVAICVVAALASQALATHPSGLVTLGPNDDCPNGEALEVLDRTNGDAVFPTEDSVNDCYPAPYGMAALDSQYLIRMDSPGEVLDDSFPIAHLEKPNEQHTCIDDGETDCASFKATLVSTGCWGDDEDAAFNSWANAMGAICAISVSGGSNFAQLQGLSTGGYQINGKGTLRCGGAGNIVFGSMRPADYGSVTFQLTYDMIPEGALGNGSNGPSIVLLTDSVAKGTFTTENTTVNLVGEALKEGCSDPDGGNCKDSMMFAVGTKEMFADAGHSDPETLLNMEDANYMAGWLCRDNGGVCANRANFPGVDVVPTFDINGIWAGDCVVSQEEECTTPGGCGDPHFVGFDGQAFDYTGLPGSSFSVISTPTVQVNAALVPETINGLTYMGAVGVLTPAGRITVTAHPETKSVLVEVNEVVVAKDDATKVYDLGSGVSVRYLDAQSVRVSVASVMAFKVSLRHEQFLDIPQVALSMTPTAHNIHGVLGQTAMPERAIGGFEGQEEEYIVTSLFSVDSMYNRYEGADTGVRQMASAVPLLQSASDTVLLASATNSDM